MSVYTGSIAGKIIAIQESWKISKTDKINALIKEQIDLGLEQSENATAEEVAKKINKGTLDAIHKHAYSTTLTTPDPKNEEELKDTIENFLKELNEKKLGKDEKNGIRQQVHAAIYRIAEIQTPAKIYDTFSMLLRNYRKSPTNPLDDTETDLEKAINATFIITEQAKKMDGSLKDTQQQLFKLSNPNGAWKPDHILGLMLLNDSKKTYEAAMDAYEKQKPSQPKTHGELLSFLADEFKKAPTDELRDQIHALAYQVAYDSKRGRPENTHSIEKLFTDTLAQFHNEGKVDKTKTILEHNVISGTESKYHLLSTNRWERERNDILDTTKESAQKAIEEAKKLASSSTPSTTPSTEDVLTSLIKAFKDPTRAKDKDTLRDQIHAVAYTIATEESTKSGNKKSIDAIFNEQLGSLRKSKDLDDKSKDLDDKPTKLEQLRLGEKKYDALVFMEKAMEAGQQRHPHDADKVPNTLELLHAKLIAINKEVEPLQAKAATTKNPIERTQLELEAANILRLYDEVSAMLKVNESGIVFKDKDARVRDSLVGSLDAESNIALQHYLTALEAQRAALASIAGKNTKESTPIPVGVLQTTEDERTATIKKQGDFYGNISFKERDTDGNWKTRTLKGKDGKPITGLTRDEIMSAITRAENQLRIELQDPTYKIKVTEDRDGTIHCDTGNKHNLDVLHKAFVATYDLKLDRKAAAEAAASPATASVSHAAGASNEATVIYTPPPGAGGPTN